MSDTIVFQFEQCKSMKVQDDDVLLLLPCRQLRFSLYSGVVTTKVLTIIVLLYYSLSLALWGILCLMPLA